MEHSGTLWNTVGPCGTPWDLVEHSDPVEHHSTLWNTLGLCGTLSDPVEHPGTLYLSEAAQLCHRVAVVLAIAVELGCWLNCNYSDGKVGCLLPVVPRCSLSQRHRV